MNTLNVLVPQQKRYVDDTFILIQEDLMEEFRPHLNSVEKTILLTKELENEGRLSFLDVVVSRKENGTITAEVHRKPTHTGQYLNYHSYCPMEHKKAVGKALFRRGASHLGDLTFRCKEEQKKL